MTVVRQDAEMMTMTDLLARLGGVPLDRIRFRPAPGTAVEQDVVDLHDRENRLFELVEGVLVEKPMGFLESRVAALLIQVLGAFVEEGGLGIVAGADGMMRLAAGLVRIPDVSVVLWERLPGRQIPREPIPSLAPDLAIEVLSASNTPAEMDRKISEYFAAGSQCVWIVDPVNRSIRTYVSPATSLMLIGDDVVTAESVLPGFRITVSEVFKRAGIS